MGDIRKNHKKFERPRNIGDKSKILDNFVI